MSTAPTISPADREDEFAFGRSAIHDPLAENDAGEFGEAQFTVFIGICRVVGGEDNGGSVGREGIGGEAIFGVGQHAITAGAGGADTDVVEFDHAGELG